MTVKQAVFSLIVTLALALAGCSPSEQSAQQQEAAEQFSQAFTHVKNATCGYIATQGFTGTLADYQAQQLDTAIATIKPVLSIGSPAQQATAALLLADVLASRAVSSADEASRQWTRQSEVATQMLITVAGARGARNMADTQSAADTQELLDDLNRRLSDARALAARHQQTIDDHQRQIDAMTSQRQQLLSRIADARSQSQKLAAQVQQTTGQMRYDTYLQSAQAARAAAKDSAAVDELSAKIDMLTSARDVAKANKAVAVARSERLTEAVAEVTDLNTAVTAKVNAARRQANAAAGQISTAVSELAAEHSKQVVERFDAARADLQAAIDALTQAAAKSREHRDEVELALATRRYELALINTRYAMALASYRDLIGVLAEQAMAGFRDTGATTIRETAKLATEQAEKTAADATAALTEARQALQSVSSDAGSVSIKDAAAAMLQHVQRQISRMPADS